MYKKPNCGNRDNDYTVCIIATHFLWTAITVLTLREKIKISSSKCKNFQILNNLYNVLDLKVAFLYELSGQYTILLISLNLFNENSKILKLSIDVPCNRCAYTLAVFLRVFSPFPWLTIVFTHL